MNALPILAPIITQIVGSLFPDPGEKAKAEAEVMKQLIASQDQIGDIIKTEAASEHWLTANWRPITMLVFVGLIVARWFGVAAPGLTEPEYLKLWSIVEIGIGGYVIGRTVEKTIPDVARVLKR